MRISLPMRLRPSKRSMPRWTRCRPHLPPGPLSREEQYARPHKDESFCWDEPYTLPENQFLAWQRGAGRRYRDLGVRYLADSWYWNPLAAGENVLPGKHAYSHVNAMSSAMQAYFVLGDEKYLRAATNGFGFVRDTQSFATGGWGPDEQFRKPGSGEIGESLTKTHSSFETPCGSYGHFKITRYLLRATRDSRYGDSMERVMYNTILGAKPIKQDGHGFYYSDYNNDGHKLYHPQKWTLLHRHLFADHRRLWNQRILSRCRRHLRQPLHSIAREVVPRRAADRARPDDELPASTNNSD